MTFIDSPPRLSEAQFMSQVVKLAKLCGWACYHTRRSEGSEPGFPDLVLVRRPRVIFAELKAQRTPVTPAQLGWIGELRACGQDAVIWRPSDFEVIERTLAR